MCACVCCALFVHTCLRLTNQHICTSTHTWPPSATVCTACATSSLLHLRVHMHC